MRERELRKSNNKKRFHRFSWALFGSKKENCENPPRSQVSKSREQLSETSNVEWKIEKTFQTVSDVVATFLFRRLLRYLLRCLSWVLCLWITQTKCTRLIPLFRFLKSEFFIASQPSPKSRLRCKSWFCCCFVWLALLGTFYLFQLHQHNTIHQNLIWF